MKQSVSQSGQVLSYNIYKHLTYLPSPVAHPTVALFQLGLELSETPGNGYSCSRNSPEYQKLPTKNDLSVIIFCYYTFTYLDLCIFLHKYDSIVVNTYYIYIVIILKCIIIKSWYIEHNIMIYDGYSSL